KWNCINYRGQGGALGAPYCYGRHEGTDYMLLGGFTQMDKPNANLIVAAADGIVEETTWDQSYDRCHADQLAADFQSGISCNYKMKPTEMTNKVVLYHGFDHPNDPAYAVRTKYLHI